MVNMFHCLANDQVGDLKFVQPAEQSTNSQCSIIGVITEYKAVKGPVNSQPYFIPECRV